MNAPTATPIDPQIPRLPYFVEQSPERRERRLRCFGVRRPPRRGDAAVGERAWFARGGRQGRHGAAGHNEREEQRGCGRHHPRRVHALWLAWCNVQPGDLRIM